MLPRPLAGRVALPHPKKEKALLPAAMARGESGRSPTSAGAAGSATGSGTGSPGSCATISATAPSGTWLGEGEGESEGEGAGASEGLRARASPCESSGLAGIWLGCSGVAAPRCSGGGS